MTEIYWIIIEIFIYYLFKQISWQSWVYLLSSNLWNLLLRLRYSQKQTGDLWEVTGSSISAFFVHACTKLTIHPFQEDRWKGTSKQREKNHGTEATKEEKWEQPSPWSVAIKTAELCNKLQKIKQSTQMHQHCAGDHFPIPQGAPFPRFKSSWFYCYTGPKLSLSWCCHGS